MKPRILGHTGNATTDRQNREFGRGTHTVTVVVSGQTRSVYKTFPHLLGFSPQSWRVVSGPSGVTEPPDGMRGTRNDATLLFPGNGRWQVEVSA